MKKTKFAENQITYALRQTESGTSVADVCRQLGVIEARFNVWTKKDDKLGLTELCDLRQLRDENARQERAVADLTADKRVSASSVR